MNNAASRRVLIVDDEPVLCTTLTRILKNAGIPSLGVGDGVTALETIEVSEIDLIYLDIHLPEMDGLEVLKTLQQRGREIPVILLTAHASLQSALEALRLGASDYLVKPINPETIVSRTRVILAEQAAERREHQIMDQIELLQQELAQMRRARRPSESGLPIMAADQHDRFLQQGKLVIDLQARAVTFGDRVVNLPPTAFDYLVALTQHCPAVVTYQALVTEAQGYKADRRESIELNKYHIHVLREALEPDPKDPRYILNVRGVGYRLDMVGRAPA
jgi:DNA-binding response OmpR family regulator